VRLEHLGSSERSVVGLEGVHAIAPAVIGDGVLVGVPLHDAADLEVAADVMLVQDELDLQVNLGGASQSGLVGGQALARVLELFASSGPVAQALGVLAQRRSVSGELQTQTMDQASMDGSGARWTYQQSGGPLAVGRVAPIPDQRPIGRVGLNPFVELRVLQMGTRHHGNEAAAGAIDVVHVFARTEF
jgi:hypothetical protein